MAELVRVFRARPGHDCFVGCVHGSSDCRPGSGGFHGIGSVRLFFAVAVPGRGAVSFDLETPMYPTTVHKRGGLHEYEPLGAVDFHYGDAPDYLKEWAQPRDCDLIGAQCWGDVTFCAADAGYEAFTKGGEKAVWAWLAETYLPTVLTVPARSSTRVNLDAMNAAIADGRKRFEEGQG